MCSHRQQATVKHYVSTYCPLRSQLFVRLQCVAMVAMVAMARQEKFHQPKCEKFK